MTTNESDCTIPEINYTEHWNAAYTKNPTEKLGWYEENSTKTLELITKTELPKDARILNVGVGSSLLIDELLAEGYTNLIANDLSEKSLDVIKERLGETSATIEFLVDDLIQPTKLQELASVDIWNDRAVLHFFLKKEEQQAYFNLLKKVVKRGGFAIIAVFATDGAEKCCGLPLQRYDEAMLQTHLGSDFELRESFRHTFVNPYGGERPYVYTLFQRKN